LAEKELIADKIYAALKNEARGEKQISIKRGEAAASLATNMPVGIVRGWMHSMATLEWIQMDGKTIWLSKDYGKRVVTLSQEEQEILTDVYGPAKGKKIAEERQGKESK